MAAKKPLTFCCCCVAAAAKRADVTGVVIAENLIETATRRAADLGLDSRFDHGDAEAMPYDEDLTGLVYSLTPRPKEEHLPWWKTPEGFGVAVLVLAVVLNVLFW